MKTSNKFIVAVLYSTAMSTPIYTQVQDYAGAINDEVIVTATRRAQNLQDIPLEVTAITPTQLKRQGVTNVTQTSQVRPCLLI